MRKRFLYVADAIDRAARFIVMTLMVIMCVVVLFGVFFRYVVGDALTWTEEVSRYLMIWLGFIGAGLALREGGHVAVDALINRLPAKARRSVIFLVRLLCIAFLASVIGSGALLILKISGQITPVLGISMGWPYVAVPIGCLLVTIEMIALMIRDPDQRGLDPDSEATLSVRS
jgi:TRAP-type C4-dicarboxylate transport system permease small subunit